MRLCCRDIGGHACHGVSISEVHAVEDGLPHAGAVANASIILLPNPNDLSNHLDVADPFGHGYELG